MTVHVRYFAILKDRVGVAGSELELGDGATIAAAMSAIARQNPSLASLLPRVAPAINHAYARPDDVLHDGDELALIPPVSGG